MAPIVELRNVTQAFGKLSHRPVVVLEHIDLAVDEQEFVCIVGPSGCGKSTLLRVIMGLIEPTDGEVYYRGRRIEGVCERMVMVFQTFALFPWLTVVENIEVGLSNKTLRKDERRERVESILRLTGLEGFEEAYPRELSSGMKQRVGLARALVMDPDVLLMDEPFSSLDPLTATHLREEVLNLWLEPKVAPESVIMVTHNVEEAVYLADRVIVLTHRPGTVAKEVRIDLPRPRDLRAPELYRIVDQITGFIA